MKAIDLFRVLKVEPCAAPQSGGGGEWHRYVVANSSSRITGSRRAPLSQARRHAEQFVGEINERMRNGRSVWAPRGRPRARKP